jgi:hypothetical protein
MVLLALGCVMLAGCTSTAKVPEPSTRASIAPSVPAVTRTVDLSRLGEIGHDFPTGYTVAPNPLPGVRQLDAPQAAIIGDFVSYGEPLTAEPASCRALLMPVRADAGADSTSISSMTGVQDPFISVTATDPVSVPISIPDAGCQSFTFDVRGAIPDGSIEQLPAPSFDDSTAYGFRVELPITNPAATRVGLVEYFYTAILDGRTFVNVWARVPPDFKPEPALPDLLTKAVTAIRRQ